MGVDGCGRLSVRARWFLERCVVLCVQVGWFVGGGGGVNVSWVLMVGGSASALGDRSVLCGSCLNRLTSMHDMKSIRMFEDDVTPPEHALVIQGGSLGGVWVGGVMYAI